MNLYTPKETAANYADAGVGKATRQGTQLFLLAIMAGAMIAFGSVISNTAAFGLTDPGLARLVSGLVFPFGLGMVMLTGAELFTGNTLLIIPVLERRIGWGGVLRNWLIVYAGNAVGSVLVAASCVWFGQMELGGGKLAVYAVKVAATKSGLPPVNAFVLGILCNVLVTIAVLMCLGARDVAGKVLGVYLPIATFVIAGFEHSIANQFYGPAGLFAMERASYATLVADAGIDTAPLTWLGYLTHNLIPVTLGNIVGGLVVGFVYWYCHLHAAWRTPAD